jgi:SAM-dependent methyltransferase
MRPFLRKMRAREPLVVTMSGVRMGERVLQIGVDDPRLTGTLVAKVGLSGHAAIAVGSEDAAERARQGSADSGGLADVHVTTFDTLPFAAHEFDVVVVHSAGGLLASFESGGRLLLLRECHRVLRPGGRLVTVEAGARTGLRALFQRPVSTNPDYEQAGGAAGALGAAGFKPVRTLAERDGYRFTEGFRSAAAAP